MPTKIRDLLPYGAGLLLALALFFAWLLWTSGEDGSEGKTLPEVYNVL